MDMVDNEDVQRVIHGFYKGKKDGEDTKDDAEDNPGDNNQPVSAERKEKEVVESNNQQQGSGEESSEISKSLMPLESGSSDGEIVELADDENMKDMPSSMKLT